jgi:microcystin-dependent protein
MFWPSMLGVAFGLILAVPLAVFGSGGGSLSPDLPQGTILAYGGTAAPSGFVMADGSAKSRTGLAACFAVLSTTYGVGDGSTTFNVPDMRQRFPLGKAAAGTGSTLGGTGGAIDFTVSIPAHFHGMGTGATLNIVSSGSHSHNATYETGPGALTTFAAPDVTSNGGGSLPGGTSGVNAASHTHIAGDFAGIIGLVTGGVDGNASMTSGTNNAPFQVVNYIVRCS